MLAALLVAATLLLSTAPAARAHAPSVAPPDVPPVLDTAIARMGGLAALQGVERVRLEMLTQWQRISFEKRPYTDLPSYELHTDTRDYAIGGWRNRRRFPAGGSWREVTDVVRDSVSIRRIGEEGAWVPLSLAYVDERDELFAFAPERVLLLARAAADLRALPDTTIGGAAHARVHATVGRYPATLFVRRGDGFLAMARWVAAHPADFGLAPWGEMEVELWYSNWSRFPNGVAYPRQWDVRRVGRPYKRMTVLAAEFDLPAMPDSFAVEAPLRDRYAATANRRMHDVPFDSARVVDGRFVAFNAIGAPAGAVKLGNRWVLLEAGQGTLSAERAASWLLQAAPGSRLAAALVTMPAQGSGGAAWLAQRAVPVLAAPGAEPFMRTVLRNHGAPASALTTVASGRWLRVDGDSLWLEPIDLPNGRGSLLVYAPSLRWAYAAMAAAPLELELVRARIRERGWTVERLGTARAIVQPMP